MVVLKESRWPMARCCTSTATSPLPTIRTSRMQPACLSCMLNLSLPVLRPVQMPAALGTNTAHLALMDVLPEGGLQPTPWKSLSVCGCQQEVRMHMVFHGMAPRKLLYYCSQPVSHKFGETSGLSEWRWCSLQLLFLSVLYRRCLQTLSRTHLAFNCQMAVIVKMHSKWHRWVTRDPVGLGLNISCIITPEMRTENGNPMCGNTTRHKLANTWQSKEKLHFQPYACRCACWVARWPIITRV